MVLALSLYLLRVYGYRAGTITGGAFTACRTEKGVREPLFCDWIAEGYAS